MDMVLYICPVALYWICIFQLHPQKLVQVVYLKKKKKGNTFFKHFSINSNLGAYSKASRWRKLVSITVNLNDFASCTCS